MFTTSRSDMRKVFFEAWRKHLEKLPLEPLEMQIIDVLVLHPEYHSMLNNPERYSEKDFDETSPFLHLSLHIAIREQINTNRPAGIEAIFQQISKKLHDIHSAEHKMMECLANFLWEVQQTGRLPSAKHYLDNLNGLL